MHQKENGYTNHEICLHAQWNTAQQLKTKRMNCWDIQQHWWNSKISRWAKEAPTPKNPCGMNGSVWSLRSSKTRLWWWEVRHWLLLGRDRGLTGMGKFSGLMEIVHILFWVVVHWVFNSQNSSNWTLKVCAYVNYTSIKSFKKFKHISLLWDFSEVLVKQICIVHL